ncbi:MAG: hydrogenase iron-sulfur subunit, partial [Gammaproteobacteria bacterium]|nr:hydrogenase iron-sulfur subunit [Gammaproteobacteria bacterium]
ITYTQWYAGGIMRSLHRYASDALVVVMVLHLLREYIKERMRGARSFSWVTGLALLWFVFASGISGYWVVWDKFAQYIAIATTEWLDSLGIFAEPIARNFLHDTTLSGRFFTLMVFIHIAVPLILLFLLWVHIQRCTHPKVNPPLGLAAGTLAMLLCLSLAFPAVSQGPVNLNQVPSVVSLDWFYLGLYPLLDRYSGQFLWSLLIGGTLALAILPWVPYRRRQPAAVVDLDNCNGCNRCAADCPFSAVTMGPRTDGKPFEHQAVVNPNLCVSCGICVGACPTSTPFRRRTELVPGIDLPTLPIREVREQTLKVCAELNGDVRILVFGCTHGPNLQALQAQGTAIVSLNCIAMLPPAFIDLVVSRNHADGVFLTGCRQGDCHYRLGLKWMEQRINGERDPFLRKRAPRERIVQFWGGAAQQKKLIEELNTFRTRLLKLQEATRANTDRNVNSSTPTVVLDG